jgi:hypothetical protein
LVVDVGVRLRRLPHVQRREEVVAVAVVVDPDLVLLAESVEVGVVAGIVIVPVIVCHVTELGDWKHV